MSTSIQSLSTFTGLSEVELQKRAQEFVAAGKVKGLSALEEALVATTTGPKQSTVEAFGAMTAASTQSAHALEEPAQVLARGGADAGFAAAPATASLVSASSSASLDKAAANGSARVKGFGEAVSKSVSNDELNIAGGDIDSSSRSLMFEQLKMQMQKMSQIFQLNSNVLSSTHETAKTAINNLKA
jgi:hypothetical protein